MKKLALILWFVWLAVGKSATISFSLSDFAANPLAIKTVRLTPVSQSQGSGTTVITGDAISYSTDTNGTFTVTNIAAGAYKVECVGGNTATTFYILAPTNTSTMSAAGLLTQPVATTGGQMAYSAKASDLRYPSVAGTNIIIFTNGAGRIVINSSSSGGGGGSGSDTNYIGATNDLWFAVTNSLKSATNNALLIATNMTVVSTNDLWLAFLNSLQSATNNSIVVSTNGIFAPLTNFSIATTNGLHLALTNFSIATTNGLDAALTAYSRSTTNSLQAALTNFSIATTNGLHLALTNFSIATTNGLHLALTNFSISTTSGLAIAEGIGRIILDGSMTQSALSNACRTLTNNCVVYWNGPFTNLVLPIPIQGWNADSNTASKLFLISSVTNVTMIGRNANFLFHGGPGDVFEFRHCQNVEMRDFSFDWLSYPFVWSNTQLVALAYYKCYDMRFIRVNISRFPGHGFNEEKTDGRYSTNLLHDSCVFVSVGCTNYFGTNTFSVDGAAIQVNDNSTVRNCWFWGCIRSIEIEGIPTGSSPMRGRHEGIIIENCNIINAHDWGIGLIGTSVGSAKNRIRNCNFWTNSPAVPAGWGKYPVYLLGTNSDLTISGCSFVATGPSIYTAGNRISGVKITENHFATNTTGVVFQQQDGSGFGIFNCVIANNTFIEVDIAVDASLRNSSFIGNSFWRSGRYNNSGAMHFRKNGSNATSELTIVGNTFWDNRSVGSGAMRSGIYLESGVTNCVVQGNSGRGYTNLLVWDATPSNRVETEGTNSPVGVRTNLTGSRYVDTLTGAIYYATNATGGWLQLY